MKRLLTVDGGWWVVGGNRAKRRYCRRLLSIFFLLATHYPLLTTNRLYADGKGSTSFNFLKVGVGSRQMGMANCAVALDGDVNSSAYNPATLADVAQQEVGFLHTQFLDGIQYQYAAYAYPHSRLGTFGLSFNYVTFGAIQGYDTSNRKTTTINASDMAVGFTYAKAIFQGFHLGFTSRLIKEDLYAASGQAYGFDLGALYRPSGSDWWSKLAAGLGVRNLGTKVTFIREAAPLPTQYDVGISYTDWGGRLVGTIEAHKPIDAKAYYSLGAEVTTRRFLSLRTGFRTDKDLGPNFSAGFGLLFWNESLKFDYAFVPFETFGNVHRFGLIYRFGGIAMRHYKAGVRLMRASKYAEAILEFDKVLQQDPSHYMAARYMKMCAEQLKKGE